MELYFYNPSASFTVKLGSDLVAVSEICLKKFKRNKSSCVFCSERNIEFKKKAVPGFIGRLEILDPIDIGMCKVISIEEDKLVSSEIVNMIKERSLNHGFIEKWVILQLLDHGNKIMAVNDNHVAEIKE